jgi:hypothetical protein
MDKAKPNYTDLGLSSQMGPQLRSLVELHLAEDLKFYGIKTAELRFDWSDSCIEGHDTNYLDGSLENFSGIAVFDNHENLVADGWMEFIHEGDFFLAYWEYVTAWDGDMKLSEKKYKGIPNHVWEQIPDGIKPNLESEKMK